MKKKLLDIYSDYLTRLIFPLNLSKKPSQATMEQRKRFILSLMIYLLTLAALMNGLPKTVKIEEFHKSIKQNASLTKFLPK